MLTKTKKMKIILESVAQTKKLGEEVGKKILKDNICPFLALEGDLGSGKTTFLQGLAKGLLIKETVTSPTYIIFKKYKINGEKFFYHFDAYRITEKDLDVLNFKEIVENKNNIIAVEWSENIGGAIPQQAITMKFSFIDYRRRKLIVNENHLLAKH